MAFDRFDGEVESGCDFFVAVAACDELEDFAFAVGELVEVGVGVGAPAGAECVEASRLIHEAQPQLPIILVSASQYADGVANARIAGAVGYVQKSRLADDLIETILAVLQQEAVAQDRMQDSLARDEPDIL